MGPVFVECPIKEQRCCVWCQKDSMQRLFTQKRFLFTEGSVCRVKRFTTGPRNVANVSLMNRLKRRCGSGWDNDQNTSMLRVSTQWAKRWGKFINVGGGYMYISRNKCSFSGGEYHTFYILYPFVTHLLSIVHLRPQNTQLAAYRPCVSWPFCTPFHQKLLMHI
jgi:excinuclease UvrABC ATPase subunit